MLFVHKVEHIAVYNDPQPPEGSRNLLIDFSLDGQQWTTVYAHNGSPFGGADGKPLVINLPNAYARYVGVRVASTEPQVLHLDEVEVYGMVPGLPLPTSPLPGATPAATQPQPAAGAEPWEFGVYAEIIDGRLTIKTVKAGSMAALADLQPGDQMIRVNGQDPLEMSIAQLRQAFALAPGQQVVIQTVRPATGAASTQTLTRR